MDSDSETCSFRRPCLCFPVGRWTLVNGAVGPCPLESFSSLSPLFNQPQDG